MNEDLQFLKKHLSKGALLDANLLLVYVVGKTHSSCLSGFHHTKQYHRDFRPAVASKQTTTGTRPSAKGNGPVGFCRWATIWMSRRTADCQHRGSADSCTCSSLAT